MTKSRISDNSTPVDGIAKVSLLRDHQNNAHGVSRYGGKYKDMQNRFGEVEIDFIIETSRIDINQIII